MMSGLLFGVLVCIPAQGVYYNAIYTGDYESPYTWKPSGIPGTGDTINIGSIWQPVVTCSTSPYYLKDVTVGYFNQGSLCLDHGGITVGEVTQLGFGVGAMLGTGVGGLALTHGIFDSVLIRLGDPDAGGIGSIWMDGGLVSCYYIQCYEGGISLSGAGELLVREGGLYVGPHFSLGMDGAGTTMTLGGPLLLEPGNHGPSGEVPVTNGATVNCVSVVFVAHELPQVSSLLQFDGSSALNVSGDCEWPRNVASGSSTVELTGPDVTCSIGGDVILLENGNMTLRWVADSGGVSPILCNSVLGTGGQAIPDGNLLEVRVDATPLPGESWLILKSRAPIDGALPSSVAGTLRIIDSAEQPISGFCRVERSSDASYAEIWHVVYYGEEPSELSLLGFPAALLLVFLVAAIGVLRLRAGRLPVMPRSFYFRFCYLCWPRRR